MTRFGLIAAFALGLASGSAGIAQVLDARGTLRNATIAVRDAEPSLKFYGCLSFSVSNAAAITSPDVIARLGLPAGSPARMIYLKSDTAFSWGRVKGGRVGLLESPAYAVPLPPAATPRVGAVILAHEVQGIDAIATCLRERGAPVLAPLKPTPSGRSRSMMVADPNGVHVELYEYVKNPDFEGDR